MNHGKGSNRYKNVAPLERLQMASALPDPCSFKARRGFGAGSSSARIPNNETSAHILYNWDVTIMYAMRES